MVKVGGARSQNSIYSEEQFEFKAVESSWPLNIERESCQVKLQFPNSLRQVVEELGVNPC